MAASSSRRPRVKICGLTNLRDAEVALQAGADALGVVLEPTSPRYVEAENSGFILELGPFVQTFAVFGHVRLPIPAHFTAIQSLDVKAPDHETRPFLRSFRITAEDSIEGLIAQFKGYSSVLIEARSAEGFGGTGHRLDWGFAAELVAASPVPIVLAGGLKAENVAEAVNKVRPAAVDVSSGVEKAYGQKDHGLVRAFIQAAKGL